jgi:hypothetical protein
MATQSADIDPMSQAIAAFNRYRLLQDCSRETPYDEPEVDDGRVYFRNGYRQGLVEGWPDWARRGDWSGYAIDLSRPEMYEVIFSRKPERSAERVESIDVTFSRIEDAVKYVLTKVGDTMRTRFGLSSLFVLWKARGLDPRLDKIPPTAAEIQRMIDLLPPGKAELVQKHLQRLVLREHPQVQSISFPGAEPYMNVIPLTYRELERALTHGLPDDVLACFRKKLSD